MSTDIQNTMIFLKTHTKFLEQLSQMLKEFMQQKDNYMLSDRYIPEFIEKYEKHNL